MKHETKHRGIYEKQPGSGIWYVRYTDASGRLRREKAGTKSAAILLRTKSKQEALEGRKLPEKLRRRVVLFHEVAQDALEYSRLHKRSYRDDCYRMAPLLEWFGGRVADSITPKELEQHLAEQGWAPATINRYRDLLSLAYRLAIGNGKLRENPARLVPHRREDNARLRFLSPEEEERLHNAILELFPEHLPEFELALHTGLRRGEQYGLRWEDVDWERRLLTIPRSKNGGMRHVPLNATALHALVELRNRNSLSHLVCGGSRCPRYWFVPAIKAAGLSDFTWHCLRHTFASRLVMAGVDIRTVAELLGHRTLTMTMRYTHLAPDHQRAAVERLERTDTRTDTAAEELAGYIQ